MVPQGSKLVQLLNDFERISFLWIDTIRIQFFVNFIYPKLNTSYHSNKPDGVRLNSALNVKGCANSKFSINISRPFVKLISIIFAIWVLESL